MRDATSAVLVNWKTSLTGLVMLLAACLDVIRATMNGMQPNWETVMSSVIAGIGLLCAKDHNVTGGTVKQAEKPVTSATISNFPSTH